MSTTLAKPKQKQQKKAIPKYPIPSHTPNYITILPPGELIEEKISEMGIDTAELARRMEVPIEIVERLIRFEIPLTQTLAEKVEKATQMPARNMMRYEKNFRRDLEYAMTYPEIPAYLGTEIINQPKKGVRKQK